VPAIAPPASDSLVLPGLRDCCQQDPAQLDRLVETAPGLPAGQDDEVLQEPPGLGKLVVDVEQLGQQVLVTDAVLQVFDNLQAVLQRRLRAAGHAHEHGHAGGPG